MQGVKSSGAIRKAMAPPVNGRGAREDAKIMVCRPMQFRVKGRCLNSLAAQAKELDQPLETHVIGCKSNVVQQYRFRLHWVSSDRSLEHGGAARDQRGSGRSDIMKSS